MSAVTTPTTKSPTFILLHCRRVSQLHTLCRLWQWNRAHHKVSTFTPLPYNKVSYILHTVKQSHQQSPPPSPHFPTTKSVIYFTQSEPPAKSPTFTPLPYNKVSCCCSVPQLNIPGWGWEGGGRRVGVGATSTCSCTLTNAFHRTGGLHVVTLSYDLTTGPATCQLLKTHFHFWWVSDVVQRSKCTHNHQGIICTSWSSTPIIIKVKPYHTHPFITKVKYTPLPPTPTPEQSKFLLNKHP